MTEETYKELLLDKARAPQHETNRRKWLDEQLLAYELKFTAAQIIRLTKEVFSK